MLINLQPYVPTGFAAYQEQAQEFEENLAALLDELERRHKLAGTDLVQALKEHTPEGLFDAYERLKADGEVSENDPSPAGFYCHQIYDCAKASLLAQIYMLELGRIEPRAH